MLKTQQRSRRLPGGVTRTFGFAAALMVSTMFLAPAASAQSLESALQQTTFSGMVGALNFDYLNHGHSSKDNHAFAVGGHLVAHTGSFEGFSVGLGGYTAQSLGIYNNLRGSTELTGNYHSIQSFRQAYLQYQNDTVEIRFGRQLINTPWANPDYYTFNPRAFMGVAGKVDVIGGKSGGVDAGPLQLSGSDAKFSIFAARMFNYDSRYSSSFISGNRYTSAPTNGFITLGALFQDDFQGNHITVQGWYYDFYHFAQLFYGEADVTHPISPNTSVLGAVQIVSEGNSSGDGVFQFTDGNANSVDAHIYGGKLGMSFGNDTVALVGDYSPVNYNSYRHGGLVHPYNDLTGTDFTDTMQAGLEDLGPGYAYGITSKFGFLNNKLGLSANYIRYVARYGFGGSTYSYNGPYGFPVGTPISNQKLWALQVGASYDLSSILKGLYVEDDTDIEVAENRGDIGPYHNPYFSNRFYFKYRF
ncbi:hypothetical protein [Acidiphilium iwatense]|uniref:Outer membrane porin, OprD family n=1 Tax=Acidiphilium iwatense TaxID=768198 RepID=A0ABS9DRM4_9PROT|nr:hypothetical protein [Acidiphilium iwatense]MCF3945394.1 hypothetical protein [Acidiphilium iwatense]